MGTWFAISHCDDWDSFIPIIREWERLLMSGAYNATGERRRQYEEASSRMDAFGRAHERDVDAPNDSFMPTERGVEQVLKLVDREYVPQDWEQVRRDAKAMLEKGGLDCDEWAVMTRILDIAERVLRSPDPQNYRAYAGN